ncbi:ABC transporter ATP-binding protein [Meiothermus granaticius]|uniref:High-affinity zinc uptake system ATP-binding protein ZnuC n=1 Tax=Meiothermus granaticius NBRC 107808 TaxID=1227551 RepID=A0A399FD18_9DEIN|nr:ABC transporter ATP-binding protein [Meiothermus granaticius]MCL6526445.1 ABC transporter ATP-binding protein [Thermaceae bacterium]RIH92932.1 High-affinity zinc uptake system ATP-binding protein ZnuC [Meiothermus granaticius NBRC 107808]GEM86788.1 putative daunorubicin resistance ABC transporter ATP-binding subunit DrrA [Meiothermus granaticius NBRC 107808]
MVSIQNLWKQYSHSKEPALRAINLELQGGRFYGLLGPNGSGKTTLSRLLVGLLRPTKGSITINGIPINNGGKVSVPIGYVPEAVPYFPGLTAKDLIEFALVTQGYWGAALHKARKEVVELLDITALEQKLIWHMSGGQAKMTLIAAALSFKPAILVLDEPNSGLDFKNRRKLWSVLGALKGSYKPTILLVTHDIKEVESIIDEAIILRKGRVFTQGSVPDLRRKYSPLLVCTVITDQISLDQTVWQQVSSGHYQRLIPEELTSSILQELDMALKTGAAEISIRAASLEEVVFAQEKVVI